MKLKHSPHSASAHPSSFPLQNEAILKKKTKQNKTPLAFHCRSNFQKQSHLIFHPNRPNCGQAKMKAFPHPPKKHKQQAMYKKKSVK